MEWFETPLKYHGWQGQEPVRFGTSSVKGQGQAAAKNKVNNDIQGLYLRKYSQDELQIQWKSLALHEREVCPYWLKWAKGQGHIIPIFGQKSLYPERFAGEWEHKEPVKCDGLTYHHSFAAIFHSQPSFLKLRPILIVNRIMFLRCPSFHSYVLACTHAGLCLSVVQIL